MRTIALEEHFTVPELVHRIDPARIVHRGFPPPNVPLGPMREADRLADLGPARLADMDAAGITVQVLSVPGLARTCCRRTRARHWRAISMTR